MKRFLLILAVVTGLSVSVRAAVVDTVMIYSAAMHQSRPCVVIRPDSEATTAQPVPVVYLLHGYGGWYANWIIRVPQLKTYADLYQVLIVCPDGMNSWYIDSPIDSTSKFETYVAKEIPAYIDTHYATIRDRSARAITGLSMGGHGGLFLGFRHSNFFGACGSMSGGLDVRPFPKSWELPTKLGDTANWSAYTVYAIIENKPADSLAIIIDCGTEDFFYKVNQQMHEKLMRLHIAHDYIQRPGQHNWDYWRNAIQYQLLFFHNYFVQQEERRKMTEPKKGS